MKIELPHEPIIDIGKGDALIVLPDPLGNLATWTPFMDAFSETHRVLVPRLPFYIYPLSPVRAEDITAYLEKFLNANGVSRAVIIGTGIASFIALMYAWLSPKRVKRLVLTGSPELDKSPFANAAPGFRDEFSDDFPGVYPWLKTNDGTINQFYYKTCEETSDDLKHSGTVIPSLTQIAAPVLLISGLQDKVTPPEVSLEFHDLLPCSKAVFIDDCGHHPMLEQPYVFQEHVRNFLTQ